MPGSDDQIGREVTSAACDTLLSFLSHFSGAMDVAQYMDSEWRSKVTYQPRSEAYRKAFASLIYDELGDASNASRTAREALDLSKLGPARDAVVGLVAKYL